MHETFTLRTASGQELRLPVEPDSTLAQAVFTSGALPAPALCSGLGHCGRCVVRFLSPPPDPTPADLTQLSPEQLAQGLRLGCRHSPTPGAVLLLPDASLPARVETNVGAVTPEAAGLAVDLAVDLGTTTLHWQVLPASNGPPPLPPLRQGSELNPQMGAGSEVMSRLAYARTPDRARRLRLLVLRRLAELVRAQAPARVQRLCVAGNSVMTSLLLGKPLDGLARAPYRLDYHGGEETALNADLDPTGPDAACADLPPAYIPPLFAPFVGGDLSAGLAYLRFGLPQPPRYPFLLADFGTNGEFILALDERRLILASVALGPALEGIGLRHGCVAQPGAVASFDLSPRGLVPIFLDAALAPHPTPPAHCPGITGAGYLALLQRLRGMGLVEVTGRFATPDAPHLLPLARTLAARTAAEGRLPLDLPGPSGFHLHPRDVEELLKVKAACNAAFSRLLREAGLAAHALDAIYLAGALGEHAGIRNLEDLGFIPPGAGSRVRLVGNSSLRGAALLLHPQHGPSHRAWLEAAAHNAVALDLANEANFAQDFIARMTFTHVA